MIEKQVLEDAYIEAKKCFDGIEKNNTPLLVSENINVLINKIDNNKSLVQALVTSILKKAVANTQDIRLHRTDFEGGYSARSLDTSITTPFFKQYFQKYANKESSFLTLATRERIPWTKTDGQNLKIRNKEVKSAFLEVLDCVEMQKETPKTCLTYIFIQLLHLSTYQNNIIDELLDNQDFDNVVTINSILDMLDTHFKLRQSSRLPVIAMYAMYEELMPLFIRYQNKKLIPLNTHTSSDKHGYGDIEMIDENNTFFEVLEIKHNIAIDRNLIFDIAKKCEDINIQQYYILTTYPNSFKSEEERKYIEKFVRKIQQERGLKIIANGILPTIKYYLRHLEDYQSFLKTYTNALILDSKKSTEIQDFHLKEWVKILKKASL